MDKEDFINQFDINYDFNDYMKRFDDDNNDKEKALLETIDYYPQCLMMCTKAACCFGLDYYDKYPIKHELIVGRDTVIRSMLIPKEYHFEDQEILKDLTRDDIMKLFKNTIENLSLISTIIESAYKLKIMDGDKIDQINFLVSCNDVYNNIDKSVKIRFYTKKDKIWTYDNYKEGEETYKSYSQKYMELYNSDKKGYLENYILKDIN